MCSVITLKGKATVVNDAVNLRKNNLKFKGGDSFGCAYHVFTLNRTIKSGVIKDIDLDTVIEELDKILTKEYTSLVTVTLFSRSTPETENETDIDSIMRRTQPFTAGKMFYAHHGIITKPEEKSNFRKFEVDSEVIAFDLANLVNGYSSVLEFDEKYSDSSLAVTGFVEDISGHTNIFAYDNYLGLWYREFTDFVEITNVPLKDINYLSIDKGLTKFPKRFGLVYYNDIRNPMCFSNLSSMSDMHDFLDSLESFAREEPFTFRDSINFIEV